MILTKDEVVKMARQVWPEVSAGAPMPDGLERFTTLCRAPLVAEVERLTADLEQTRVQLAGCGVAAMQNTEESKANRVERGAYGWSASYGDVCRMVDREIELRAGVELPEAFAHAAYKEHPSYEGVGDIVYYHPNAKPANCIDLFTRDQLLAYGAAQRLAGQQRESCTWTEQDDKDMPGTYESSCGEMWSFIDGGVKENRVTYCHHCGGKVVPASPQEQT